MAFEEIKAKLGLDVTDFERGVSRVQGSLSNVVGGATKKLTDFKNVGQTIATALGLNLESIAEGLARMVVGFSKDQEDALNRLVETSKARADEFDRIGMIKRGAEDPEKRIKILKKELDLISKQAGASAKLTNEEKTAIYQKYNKMQASNLAASAAMSAASQEIATIDEERQKRAEEASKRIGQINNEINAAEVEIKKKADQDDKKRTDEVSKNIQNGYEDRKKSQEVVLTSEQLISKKKKEQVDAIKIYNDESKTAEQRSAAFALSEALNLSIKQEQAKISEEAARKEQQALDKQKQKREELSKQTAELQKQAGIKEAELINSRRQAELPTMAEVISGKRNIGTVAKTRATALERARAKELQLSDSEQRAREVYANAPTESAKAAALAQGQGIRRNLDMTRTQIKGLENQLGFRIKDADPYSVMIKELGSIYNQLETLNTETLSSTSIK
jgi:chromosome segregation ATPase